MDYIVGEIITFAGDFAPEGSLECMGQVLPIQEYQALYSLIGATYGGNGSSVFVLPDLRGMIAMGVSPGQSAMGAVTGTSRATVSEAQMPPHAHAILGSTAIANTIEITGQSVLASTPSDLRPYSDITKPVSNVRQLDPRSVGATGDSEVHDNIMPTACVRYAICVVGSYPTFK